MVTTKKDPEQRAKDAASMSMRDRVQAYCVCRRVVVAVGGNSTAGVSSGR